THKLSPRRTLASRLSLPGIPALPSNQILTPTMKLGVPLFVVALAASAHAMTLEYIASSTDPRLYKGEFFEATLIVNGEARIHSTWEKGPTVWLKYGIHKVGLANMSLGGFAFCIDVFGDVNCEGFGASEPTCRFNPDKNRNECISRYYNQRYGFPN
ncbi:MAG: hypothetical protein J3R72DRAFT_500944, partial [Linnemannia gamsii]